MITTINSKSDYLVGGYAHGGPRFNGIAADSGKVRYNPQKRTTETFNGIEWVAIEQEVTIGLSQEAEDIIAWARSKMEQEANLKSAMEKHPGLREAYDRFEIMKTLCGD
jgi:hypothetical protein